MATTIGTFHEFQLTFKTPNNSPLLIRIPNPNTSVTDADVREAMDRIIASNAVLSVNGAPATRSAASIIQTVRDPFIAAR
jgi:hypothetical protein